MRGANLERILVSWQKHLQTTRGLTCMTRTKSSTKFFSVYPILLSLANFDADVRSLVKTSSQFVGVLGTLIELPTGRVIKVRLVLYQVINDLEERRGLYDLRTECYYVAGPQAKEELERVAVECGLANVALTPRTLEMDSSINTDRG